MPLRDIALTAFVLLMTPYSFLKPWVGIVMWCWLTFLVPHHLTWGFARTLPFAQIIAIATLLGVVCSPDKQRRPIPFTAPTLFLMALWIVYTLTTINAWYPTEAWNLWEKISKVLLFVFLSLMYFQDRHRLRYLFLAIALSFGFYGLKGGLWVFHSSNPAEGMVVGAEGGCNSCGNNGLALALCMTLPFLLCLAREEPRKWLRWILRAMLVMSPIAVLFTFSRTGLVTMPIVFLMMFARGRRKVLGFIVLAVFAIGVYNFAPQRLFERAESIQTRTDLSTQMRFESFYVAWRFALDHPLGGGFWVLDHDEIYQRYLATYIRAQSAHNVYLEVLANQGFIGMFLFIGLILSSYFTFSRLIWALKKKPEAEWLVNYSRTVQISLTAYLIGGNFLPLSYWDLFYHLCSFAVLLRVIAEREGYLVPTAVGNRSPAPLRIPAAVSTS